MTSLSDRHAVLLDPHPLWLDAVEQVLHKLGIGVVGKTSSPSEALSLIEREGPDLLVTELVGEQGSGDAVTFLRRANETPSNRRTVVLSMHEDAPSIEAAFDAGASAYVLKTAHPDDLASAIRQAFGSSVYLPGARRATGAAPAEPVRNEVDESPGLTRRELEILKLVAEGHSNAELARMLWVTEQTVKFHLSNIYRKLDVSNRTEASRWAQVNGLLAPARPHLSVA
jgi:DNA-binding NarL/FixJ family response regulator